MFDKTAILAFLVANKPFLYQEFGVKKIGLFGSYARQEETSTSDIDFVVELEVRSLLKRLALKQYLEEHFGKKVDVVSIFGIRPIIWESMQEDLVYA